MLSPVYARVLGAGIRSAAWQTQAKPGKRRQSPAKQADNVNDHDNEYDNEYDTDNDTESDTETVPASVSGSAAMGFSGV